jgi:RNA polymerase sigma factor (sigma-70 family)
LRFWKELEVMNDWIERARGGDRAAKSALVDRLRPRLERMAAYYARCTGEDVDDLLQEAWLGLLDALPVLDLRIGRPEQYLIKRAKWRMLDAVKRARVRRCAPLDEDLPLLVDGDADTALDAASLSQFQEQLKDNQRAVLQCLLNGLTWREAGSALGCTSANVAYHVRQIRRQYEAWDEEPALAAR